MLALDPPCTPPYTPSQDEEAEENNPLLVRGEWEQVRALEEAEAAAARTASSAAAAAAGAVRGSGAAQGIASPPTASGAAPPGSTVKLGWDFE